MVVITLHTMQMVGDREREDINRIMTVLHIHTCVCVQYSDSIQAHVYVYMDMYSFIDKNQDCMQNDLNFHVFTNTYTGVCAHTCTSHTCIHMHTCIHIHVHVCSPYTCIHIHVCLPYTCIHVHVI